MNPSDHTPEQPIEQPSRLEPSPRWFWPAIAGAVAVGVAVRVYYVLHVVRGRLALVGDAETYHLLGRVLADGHGYVRPREFLEFGARVPTAEFPPAYPILLAILDTFGVDSVTGQRLFGVAVGAALVIVIGLLGREFADPVVGAVGAALAACYPHLIVFDGSLLSENVATLLVALAVLLVLRNLPPPSQSQTSMNAFGTARNRHWLVIGVLLGVAVCTRTEALLTLALLTFGVALIYRRSGGASRVAAMMVGPPATLIGLWTVRNALSLGHFQPFTNNGGTAIAGSNCDRVYSGVQRGGWRLDCVPTASTVDFDETALAGEARRQGLDYMANHLSELPGVIVARLGRTFGFWDVRSNLFFESLEGRDYEWLRAAWYAWVFIAVIALVGIWAARRRGLVLWPLMMPAVVVVIITIVTYGNQRFRMGASPMFVVLAALGCVDIARTVRARWRQRQVPTGSS